jgi:hypothetical protein
MGNTTTERTHTPTFLCGCYVNADLDGGTIWIGGDSDSSDEDAHMLSGDEDQGAVVTEGSLLWDPKLKVYKPFTVKMNGDRIMLETKTDPVLITKTNVDPVGRVKMFITDVGYTASFCLGGSMDAVDNMDHDYRVFNAGGDEEELADNEEQYGYAFHEGTTEAEHLRVWVPSEHRYKPAELRIVKNIIKIIIQSD